MPEIITRRSFLRVLTGIIAAPAVIHVASLMPLRGAPLVGDLAEANLSILPPITGHLRTWYEVRGTNEYGLPMVEKIYADPFKPMAMSSTRFREISTAKWGYD